MDREHQPSQPPGSTRTAPAKDAQPRPNPAPGPEEAAVPPATTAPDIMSRLPKTRPQRANDRRRTATGGAKASATSSSRKPSAAAKRPAAAPRKRAPAAATRAAASASTPAASTPPAGTKASRGAGAAPSLPRLAVDGATEAVKLPLKVGGRLTLRALDAVARGLRRS